MKKRKDQVYSGDVFRFPYNRTEITIKIIKSGTKYATFSLEEDGKIVIPSKQVYLENLKELIMHYNKEVTTQNSILILI